MGSERALRMEEVLGAGVGVLCPSEEDETVALRPGAGLEEGLIEEEEEEEEGEEGEGRAERG